MTRAPRILIVDDEPMNVDYIQQELEDRGYETAFATHGAEALERVSTDPPDLILLDVMMPDIDGITVCRMLKSDAATALIPIVIMTALDAREDRIRGIEAGADDFLTKPVDDRELIARVGTALRHKRAVDRTVKELESASEQLERLGARRLDVSILAAELAFGRGAEDLPAEALGFAARRFVSAFEARIRTQAGEITSSSDRSLTALFEDEDPRRHADSALEAAVAVDSAAARLNADPAQAPIEVSVAVASGPVCVRFERVETEGGAHWSLAIEGAAVDEARRLLAARGGGVLASPETARRASAPLAIEDVTLPSGAVARRVAAPSTAARDRPSQPAVRVPPRSGIGWWPPDYAGIEPEIRRAWGVEGEVYLTRTLGGKSGAHVYAVDLTCRGHAGQAILKLAAAAHPDWDEPDEADRHVRAVDACPDFARRHLPRIVHALEHDGQVATLATIAGRGLEYSLPWAECPYGQQVASAGILARGILEGWNGDYVVASGLRRPRELVRAWLDYRLDPVEGRIHAFLETTLDLRAADATFIFEGHWYPNPLAFASDAVPLPDRVLLRALTGRLHGDLHGHNVLVRSPAGDALTYYLIDLAMYEPASFLLYDHAYFELAHLLGVRGSAGAERWLGLLDAVARGATPAADDLGLVQLVSAFRGEVLGWTDRHEAHRVSNVESQYALARIAVGLSFVHKTLPDEGRLRALLYAAVALKGYLKFHQIDWPKHGRVLPA